MVSNRIFSFFAVILLAGTLIISSCHKVERIVDFPIKEKTLVLNAYFTPDSAWVFYVSKSLPVIDNAELGYVNDATIKLIEETDTIATLVNANANDRYIIYSPKAKIGKKYSVEVSHPNYPTIYASDFLRSPVPHNLISYKLLDTSLYFDPWLGISRGNMKAEITIGIDDPKAEDNYYLFYIYYIDSFDGYVNKNRVYDYETKNPAVDEKYLKSYNGNALLFNDQLFNGSRYEITFRIEDYGYYTGKNYYFVLESMSRAKYLYERSYTLYLDMQNNPFSEPIQVFNNIKNGYGIFAGYSNDVKIVVF